MTSTAAATKARATPPAVVAPTAPAWSIAMPAAETPMEVPMSLAVLMADPEGNEFRVV
ncbi:MAG: hypothetical protein LH603_05845 [Pseudonocardia sp.]|nr:hypothetical protein [Pseudonocardia sp.]